LSCCGVKNQARRALLSKARLAFFCCSGVRAARNALAAPVIFGAVAGSGCPTRANATNPTAATAGAKRRRRMGGAPGAGGPCEDT
jgi:hypothetical protein